MEAPPIIAVPRPRFPWLLAGALTLLAVVAAAVFFFFDPSRYGFYPRCAFYSLTGLECPGCGTQRAVYHLLHGHLATALRYNALFVLGLPFFAVWSAHFATRWMASGRMPQINIALRWVVLGVAVIILFGILRNIPCAPFTFLAPP